MRQSKWLMALAIAGALPGRVQAQDADAPPSGRPATAAPRRAAPTHSGDKGHSIVGVKPLPAPEHVRELSPAPGSVQPQRPVPAVLPGDPVALLGGTLHPVVGSVIERGTIILRDGRIDSMGRDLAVPPGVRIVDITGKHVWPSFLHASTVLGLTEVGAVRATNDIHEVGDINPNARAEVAVDADSELIPVTRSNGVLLAITGGRGGLISGTATLLELDGWGYRDMTLKEPAALLVNWPDMRLDRTAEGLARLALDKQEKARDGRVRMIREAFDNARAWQAGRAAEAVGASIKDEDVKWAAMVRALNREIPLVVRANGVLEMKAAMKFAADLGLRLVIEGGADSWRIADQLKREGVAVILNGVMGVGRAWEAYDVNFTTPLKLHEAGVEFCIADGGDSWNARNLPYTAARAASFGLPAEVALKAITLAPARIFGVASRVGSLEVGKDATLFVSNGDALDIKSNVELAFIRGRQVDLSDRHKRLYERWRLKPRRAAAK